MDEEKARRNHESSVSFHFSYFHPRAMAKGKGYKLTSASSDGGPKVCAFFASDQGCKNGAACKFVHDVAVSNIAPKSSGTESSSVVSSESDGSDGEIDEGHAGAYASLAKDEVDQRSSSAAAAQRPSVFSANNPFISGSAVVATTNEASAVTFAPTTSTAVAATTESKKKEKKRKTSNNPKPIPELAPGETPFALSSGPVGIPAVVVSIPAITTTTPPPPAKKQKQKHEHQTTLSPPVIASFRDLKLPIAPFAVLPSTATTINVLPNSPMIQQQSAAPSSSPPPRQRPLPTATPAHLRWKDAVLSTRKHINYSTLFNFDRQTNTSEGGWISTRPYNINQCSTNPASIAIDCEMCETRDPITGKVDTKALCRLSIVDADTPHGPVLLDTLVKPKWPVVDYRTWINGISAENLARVEFTLDHAQAFMDALCSDQTIIIGHAVHNDLAALKLDHGCVVDTAMLYSHAAVTTTDESNAEGNNSSSGLTPSLRNLAHGVLGGREMPDVHDSVNDARVALACAQYYVDMGGKVNTIDKVYKRSDRPNNNNSSSSTPGGGRNGSSDQQHTSILLVHRLPVNTLPEHLTEMFLAYSSIRPKTVPDIAYTGVHGKCHVEFTSAAHAELAYSTLVGEERTDKTGKMQKRVGLKGGGYVCVRKMKKENNKGGATTPQK